MVLFLLLICLLIPICLSCIDELKSHCIDSLPGYDGNLSSTHYSGYLNAENNNLFFYWLVESKNDPANEPLIFWFAGGPGCSSLEGLLSESGPYLANKDGTLRENKHSWIDFASIVYIDSPQLVGFSYSEEYSFDDTVHYSDDNNTESNFSALKSFFELHKRFKKNDIYLFGESYGAIYVSLLAQKITNENFDIKLKGIVISNGVIDEDLDIITSLQYFYYHGFIDQPLMNSVVFQCESLPTKQDSVHCFRNATLTLQSQLFQHINLYHIFDECDESGSVSFRCVPPSNATLYLNRKDVQEKIHVSIANVPKWSVCNERHIQLVDKDEFNPSIKHPQHIQQYRTMKPVLEKMILKGIKIFFLFGDSDAICNFLTGQMIADYLGSKTTGKRPWPNGKKIYGFLTTYRSHHFATILGAGHMAAQHKPMETSHFVQSFIKNKLD